MKCDFLQRTKRTCCSLLLIVSLPAALLAGDARNVAVAVPLAAKQTEVAARNDDNPFPFVRPATMADAEYSPVRPGLSAALPPRRTGMSSSKKAAIILAIGGAAAMAGILAIKGGSSNTGTTTVVAPGTGTTVGIGGGSIAIGGPH